MFAALKDVEDDDVDISKAWESIGDSMKALATHSLGYYELKQHKPCFDEGCSKSVVFNLFSPHTPRHTFPLNFVPPKLLVHNLSYT
jgi:hypothetical protein